MTLNQRSQPKSPPASSRGKASGPLKIEYFPLGDIKPDPKNPRAHSEKQLKQIARSIELFGMNVPILIDKAMQIVAGHGRLAASKLLGLEIVPIIQLHHLSDAQRRAFMVADNRLTEKSTWDATLLGEQLKFLADAELDFSIEATGFEMAEIDLFIQGLENELVPDEADSLPALGPHAVTTFGDTWQLGRHSVLCGDALKSSSYAQLLGRRQANLVFTDPPYNVRIDGHATGNGKKKHRNFAMACGEMSKEQFEVFLTQSLTLAAEHSSAGSLHFVCMDWRHLGEVLRAGEAAYSELKNVCVWAKSNAGMGSLYRSQHELVFVFKSGKDAHRNNIQLGKFGRYRSNVWNYPGANTFGKGTGEGNLLEIHPTAKPVALVADAILDCSARGDLVLDPFLGSGTTVIAAERTGRVCYGLELDPLYIDAIVRRWQKFSGKTAVHQESGRTFDQMAEVMHG